MRVRLVVSMVSVTLAMAAQARAQAPAAKPAVATPAPTAAAAPVTSPQPAAAATTPAVAPAAPAVAPTQIDAAPAAAPAAPDAFSLAQALSGGTPMSSDDVAKRAVQTSPTVAKAEKAAQKAQLAAEQANIGIYPRVEFEARYTRLSDTHPGPFKILGMPVIFPQVLLNQGVFEARLIYPVSSVFFSVMPRHRAAMASAEAQRLQSQVQLRTVAAMAKETYYNYARARAALMVGRAALAQAEAHRRDVDALVSSGTVARVELMRADAQVASAKVAVARLEGSVAIARVALCSLLHVELADVSVNEDLEAVLPPLTQDNNGYVATALKNRSEVKSLRTLSTMHNELIDASKGDRLPVLSVGGQVDGSDPNPRYSSYDNKWYGSWAAYAALTWSPNDYANADSKADQVRADLAATLADLEQIEDALRSEVAQAVENYNASRDAMAGALTGIAAAEESYRVRREQFRAGAATATDVIDAEAELRTARMDLVNASIDGRIAKARLDRAIEAD